MLGAELKTIFDDSVKKLSNDAIREKSEGFSSELEEEIAFLESCGWAAIFGSDFGEEITMVLNETMNEKQHKMLPY